MYACAYMCGQVDVVDGTRVHIHCMEAWAGAVDDLQPLPFLHRQVNQQRFVHQVTKRLMRQVMQIK